MLSKIILFFICCLNFGLAQAQSSLEKRIFLREEGLFLIASWRNVTHSTLKIDWVVNDRPDFPASRWVTYPGNEICRIELNVKDDQLQKMNPWVGENAAWKTALLHELAHCEQISRIAWDEDEPFWRIPGWTQSEISTIWRGMKIIYQQDSDGKIKIQETRAMAAFMEIEADVQASVWVRQMFPLEYEYWVLGLAKYRSSMRERDAWHDSSWALHRLLAQKMGNLHAMTMHAVLKNTSFDLKKSLARGVNAIEKKEAIYLNNWRVLKLGADSTYPQSCSLRPQSYVECSQKVEKLIRSYLETYQKLEQRLTAE